MNSSQEQWHNQSENTTTTSTSTAIRTAITKAIQKYDPIDYEGHVILVNDLIANTVKDILKELNIDCPVFGSPIMGISKIAVVPKDSFNQSINLKAPIFSIFKNNSPGEPNDTNKAD